MSIATNPKLSAFYRWLKTQVVTGMPDKPKNRFNQSMLAEFVVTSRTHLSEVLSGKRKGRHTWKRLVKMLPLDGLSLLRQCSSWNNFAEKAYTARLKAEKENPMA